MLPIECRRCRPDDNIAELAQCLYETDPYIYPHVCNHNPSAWQDMVRSCLPRPNNVFCYQNLLVALSEGHIVGVICIIPCGRIFDFACDLAVDDDMLPYVASVQEGYFDPMMQSNLCMDGYNLVCVCVRDGYRDRHVGTRLMQYCLSLYGRDDLILEVIADNDAAISLYRHNGFELWAERLGYTPDGEDLPCYLFLRHGVPA